MHTILTEILPCSDRTVTKLRERIGLNNFVIDELSLPEFVATAFALFAYGNAVQKESTSRVVLDPSVFFREFPKAQDLLYKFLAGRALTLDQLTEKFTAGVSGTHERFLAEIANKGALDASLTVLRQQPFLQLSDGRVLIVDLQFATDLVVSGVYWLLFDGLPKRHRDTFRELWGRCFELYVLGLLGEFYPVGSQILSTNIRHKTGEIDALLDFGSDVFIFEIKSSLLTLPAKRSGDPAALSADIDRKFVRDDAGDPKAVVQLARAAQSIHAGSIPTTTTPTRIYPVLITDEPACECLGFNAYLDERFQQEASDSTGIRPLTVMSINELEEALPYSATNVFSWAELFETRFENTRVKIWSAHQAIYDLRHARKRDVCRNGYLLNRFEAIYQEMLRTYGATAALPPTLRNR
jgi:hypothetical protein